MQFFCSTLTMTWKLMNSPLTMTLEVNKRILTIDNQVEIDCKNKNNECVVTIVTNMLNVERFDIFAESCFI